MSRYILNEGYALRGWKGLPFALRYPDPHKTEFFDKESYRVVYALDGAHDIDEAALSKRQRNLLRYLIEHEVAVPAEHGERLEPELSQKRERICSGRSVLFWVRKKETVFRLL